MYTVLSQFTIQPQHVDEFIMLIREHASASLREEMGILGFDVIQDDTLPNHFYVHETKPHTHVTLKSIVVGAARYVRVFGRA